MARVRDKRATSQPYVKVQDLFHGQPTELKVGADMQLGPSVPNPRKGVLGDDLAIRAPIEPADCHTVTLNSRWLMRKQL